MGQLDAPSVMPIFVGEQSAIHQLVENWQRDVRTRECVVQGCAIAMPARCQKLVLDKEADVRREIGERPKIKIFKDLVLLHVEEVRRDLCVGTAGKAALVQFAQD